MASSQPPASGFAAINGAQIYYETQGAGLPIVLLHAGVGDSRMWDRQFESLAQTHFVVRCDLRGFGQSLNVPGRFAHYQDVASLLQYLKIGSAFIIGASFGGAVALDVAIAYPQLVSGLMLAAPALGGYRFESAEMHAFFAAEREALARGDIQAATEANLKMWVDGYQRALEDVPGAIRRLVEIMQRDIFLQPEVADVEEQELEPPAIDQLHALGVPLVVMVGDHDAPEFHTIARLIAAAVPDARYRAIPGAAHLPNLEQPELFEQIVRAALRA